MAAPADRIASIEQLHDAYAGALYLYARRRTGDPEAAEEAVQDTLVRAWRHLDRFDPTRGSMATWLFAIARNVTVDQDRRRRARPRLVGSEEPTGADAPVGAVPVEAEVERTLEAWQLAEALHGLSPEHRDAIVEVHYLGFTVREVADHHDLPVGTVKSRLYYGLRALRLRLEEMGVTR